MGWFMTTEIVSVVKENSNGALYFGVPNKISKELNLEPFMAGRIEAKKGGVKFFGFGKTVKLKINIGNKTILIAKKIMKHEGFGSLDETISNVLEAFFDKNRKGKTAIAYVYPEGFLQGKYWLIDDYEKKQCREGQKKEKNRECMDAHNH